MCQSNCPSTMTKSFSPSNFERTIPLAASLMPRSIFWRSRFRASKFCASGKASSKFSASSRCNDSSAVSNRPEAFKRGASWKPTSCVPSFAGDCATSFNATIPARCVVFNFSKPAVTSMRFSPISGTKSAIVPSATKSKSDFKSNSAAPGKPVSRPRFKSAWASLNASPAEHSS